MAQRYARPPAEQHSAVAARHSFLREGGTEGSSVPPAAFKPLTQTDIDFLSRMDNDAHERRRAQYINDMKKHPLFKPSMLEPPKPKFKTVTLDGGPIIKVHESKKTGLETKKPHKWGPLGGYY